MWWMHLHTCSEIKLFALKHLSNESNVMCTEPQITAAVIKDHQ